MAALTHLQAHLNDSTGPCRHAAAVTPNDSADLTHVCRALYVGTTGDVAVITLGGNTVTFVAVPAGAILPVVCTRVLADGTDADDIVALW